MSFFSKLHNNEIKTFLISYQPLMIFCTRNKNGKGSIKTEL